MAPANGASKAMQNRSRPAVAMPKGIVPALPLSYGKIQQKKLPTREKAKETIPPTSTAPAVQAPIASASTTNTPSAYAGEAGEEKPSEVVKESPKLITASVDDIASVTESLDGSTEGGVTLGSTEREVEENFIGVVEVKGENKIHSKFTFSLAISASQKKKDRVANNFYLQ